MQMVVVGRWRQQTALVLLSSFISDKFQPKGTWHPSFFTYIKWKGTFLPKRNPLAKFGIQPIFLYYHQNYHHYHQIYHCNHHYHHRIFFLPVIRTKHCFLRPKREGPSCHNWGGLGHSGNARIKLSVSFDFFPKILSASVSHGGKWDVLFQHIYPLHSRSRSSSLHCCF